MPEHKRTIRHFPRTDLTGHLFGRLRVKTFAGYLSGRRVSWVCECACGAVKTIRADALLTGVTQSCGCLNKEHLIAQNKSRTIHGMVSTREYRVWATMIARCHNESSDSFAKYGARGIFVCEAWRKDFSSFFADMGLRPSDHHSLERLDNDKGYSPENCIWALLSQQARNKRSNRILTWNGISMCMTDWSNSLHIPRKTLTDRLKRGWSIEKALTEPIDTKIHKKKTSPPQNGQ